MGSKYTSATLKYLFQFKNSVCTAASKRVALVGVIVLYLVQIISNIT